jgi:predicted lipid-binding transport protein (Tim44 family)
MTAKALCFATAALTLAAFTEAAFAEYEEVRILRADPVQSQTCPAGAAAAPAAPPPASSGLSGREMLGGVAGAAVGGLLGNQVGSGGGRTAATIGGAALGGFAGYKLAEEKPQQAAAAQPQGAPACILTTQYRVQYARPNGMQGEVMMSSQPTAQALMINFCGDRPCN